MYIRPRTLAFIWFVLFSFQRSLAVWRLVYLTAFTFSCQPLFICFYISIKKSCADIPSYMSILFQPTSFITINELSFI